jgi:hypothetical protein
MERMYNRMLMRKTPEERVKMCFSMLNSARRIVLSTIEDKRHWRKEMFLRFYGDEFTAAQKEKIISALEHFSKNNA